MDRMVYNINNNNNNNNNSKSENLPQKHNITYINLSRSCLYEYDSSTIVNIIEQVNVASYILYI